MSVLNVCYLLDLSSSIVSEKLKTINGIIDNSLDKLGEIAEDNDADLKVAMMTFATDTDWTLTPHGPEPVTEFAYNNFTDSNGLSNLGLAIDDLSCKLSDKKFFKLKSDDYQPVVIFLTDSESTDNYKEALDRIKKNKVWENSIKSRMKKAKQLLKEALDADEMELMTFE